jgi:hypothetical protein
MFNSHKRENLFQTRVIVDKKEELPPELKEPRTIARNKKRSQRAEQTPILARREAPDEAKSAGTAREETK